jgi:predicted ATPase
MMIEKIKIEGFKSIKCQEFDFQGLTVLTGLNSTGKSSVIQSLLLLSNFNSSSTELKEYVKKFLEFKDVRNRYENAKEIKITILADNSSSILSIEREGHWNIDNKNKLFNFEDNLFYISSNRIGQEDIASYDEDIKFGTNGKYLFGYFEQHKKDTLLIDGIDSTLEAELTHWLKYILDIDLILRTTKITTNDVKVTFTSDGLENLSPFNLGAGNSYLAKILIMGLSCKKGHILIIENPEIHLHPKAQAKLADFFVLLENMGIQVIVETHSEHFINKLRYNVYKKKLKSDDIVIYYKPSIQGDFEKISINSNGHFIDDEKSEIVFPSGFFDSTLLELLEIM